MFKVSFSFSRLFILTFSELKAVNLWDMRKMGSKNLIKIFHLRYTKQDLLYTTYVRGPTLQVLDSTIVK